MPYRPLIGAALVGACAAVPAHAATLVVDPAGSRDGACSAAAPCATLERAVAQAAPGDEVTMRAGEYPAQRIGPRVGPRDAPVIVRPVPGARVSLAGLAIHGSQIEVRGLRTRGWYVHPGAADVTLRGVHSAGAGTFITSANRVRVVGGSLLGADSVDSLQIKAATGGPEPRGIHIEGVTMGDVVRRRVPTSHTECIQVTAVIGMTVRDSIFRNCTTQGVFFKEGLGGQIERVVVENNWFGPLSGYNTLIFGDGVSQMTARYNIFAQAPHLDRGDGISQISVVANLGHLRSCTSRADYRDNLWTRARCGPTDGAPGRAMPPVAIDRPTAWHTLRRVGVASGATRTVPVPVRLRSGSVTLMVRAAGRPRIAVLAPGGRAVRAIRAGRGPGFAYVTVPAQAGVWRVSVAGSGAPTGPGIVSAHVPAGA